MAKKANKWMETVKKVRKANPGKSYMEVLILAKKVYHR